jgi:hypothetical protein
MSRQPMYNKEQTARLKDAYGDAVANKLEEFTFEGTVLATSYARHLIKFLEKSHGISLS